MWILTVILALCAFIVALASHLPMPIAALVSMGVLAVASAVVSKIGSIGTTGEGARPVVLTAWLTLDLIVCALPLLACAIFLIDKDARASRPELLVPFAMFAIALLAHAVSIVALMKWRRWGFWSLVGVSILCFAFGVATPLVGYAAFSIVNTLIVFGLMKIETQGRTTWAQLK